MGAATMVLVAWAVGPTVSAWLVSVQRRVSVEPERPVGLKVTLTPVAGEVSEPPEMDQA